MIKNIILFYFWLTIILGCAMAYSHGWDLGQGLINAFMMLCIFTAEALTFFAPMTWPLLGILAYHRLNNVSAPSVKPNVYHKHYHYSNGHYGKYASEAEFLRSLKRVN